MNPTLPVDGFVVTASPNWTTDSSAIEVYRLRHGSALANNRRLEGEPVLLRLHREESFSPGLYVLGNHTDLWWRFCLFVCLFVSYCTVLPFTTQMKQKYNPEAESTTVEGI